MKMMSRLKFVRHCPPMCTCRPKKMYNVVTMHIGRPYSDQTFMPKDLEQPLHIPVLLKDVLKIFDVKDKQLFIDMTFGAGGHTRAILNAADGTRVVCVDQDPEAYKISKSLQDQFGKDRVLPCLSKFTDVPTYLEKHGIQESSVDGILFDVGASSMQFDQSNRGFSLSSDGPLDMRMDQSNQKTPTAADIVNNIEEEDLFKIIKKYGEERRARDIAHMIVEARAHYGRISSTKELASIVASTFDNKDVYRKDKLHRKAHVATKTFQALRIFINNELNELNNGLDIAHRYLKVGGVCVGISFHSLEDRIIKRHFHEIDMEAKFSMSLIDKKYHALAVNDVETLFQKRWTPVFKTILTPSESECELNPRARSAKLRAAIKNE